MPENRQDNLTIRDSFNQSFLYFKNVVTKTVFSLKNLLFNRGEIRRLSWSSPPCNLVIYGAGSTNGHRDNRSSFHSREWCFIPPHPPVDPYAVVRRTPAVVPGDNSLQRKRDDNLSGSKFVPGGTRLWNIIEPRDIRVVVRPESQKCGFWEVGETSGTRSPGGQEAISVDRYRTRRHVFTRVCLENELFYFKKAIRSEHGIKYKIFEEKPMFSLFHRVCMRVYLNVFSRYSSSP